LALPDDSRSYLPKRVAEWNKSECERLECCVLRGLVLFDYWFIQKDDVAPPPKKNVTFRICNRRLYPVGISADTLFSLSIVTISRNLINLTLE
jgi:hypothetical protein